MYIFLLWYVIYTSLMFQVNSKKDKFIIERFQFVSGLLGMYQVWLLVSVLTYIVINYLGDIAGIYPTLEEAWNTKVNRMRVEEDLQKKFF